MKGLTKIERIKFKTKRVKAQPLEPFLIQTERLFGMSVSWEVRQGLEEWELEIHIDKELRTLNTFFNNMLFSIKTGLPFLAYLQRSSSFSFPLILLSAWNLEQWGLRWPKAPQWWQTMCLGPLGFLGRNLITWFCFLFNLWHCGLIWPITPQWWQVGTNLDPSKALDWDLNGSFDLTTFSPPLDFFYVEKCTPICPLR